MRRSAHRRTLVVEADGGSRGNPGPAGYGALVRAGDQVLAERAAAIGVATNNVAEYRGLIAGLQAAAETDPEAEVEVRMDSKLVVEQMSGRWKVKHDNLQPLAREAAALVRRLGRVSFRWVPREQNTAADRLANEAMDAAAEGRQWRPSTPAAPDPPIVVDAGSARARGAGGAGHDGAGGAGHDGAGTADAGGRCVRAGGAGGGRRGRAGACPPHRPLPRCSSGTGRPCIQWSAGSAEPVTHR